ncbi:hypothetical protein CAPTEDRAFT_198652 [Capitella teleta]|uniref:Secreted protein n=1 Tax=Capitella teleta TaxID=283909 RepID=R7V918_CAPTE|nr:hypothetical protein CAPTEDRAFT_198652 [Capitella teleta]|eukprot:ELU12856.1 hypothetical protein CAPTEDRAFT_198652 [Capitella teleta]
MLQQLICLLAVTAVTGGASKNSSLHLIHICSEFLTPVKTRILPWTVQFAADMVNNDSEILLQHELKIHLELIESLGHFQVAKKNQVIYWIVFELRVTQGSGVGGQGSGQWNTALFQVEKLP